MNQSPMGFKISPVLQEHICRLGSKLPFEESSEELTKLLRVEINAKQVERICHCYGEKLEKIDWQEAYSDAVQMKIDYPEEAPVYCMADGSMLLTRTEKWKEIKLGRIFSGQSNVKGVSKDRGIVLESVYCAHMGSAAEFWERFPKEIPSQRDLVFIGDGAKWIWKQVGECYPEATQILDYYHCKEHIYAFARDYYGKDTESCKHFVKQVMDCFSTKKVAQGMEKLRQLEVKGKTLQEKRETLMGYIENNKERIDYGTFMEKGYLIGSGAIEAAHRNVIQKRLKLSGQRWTIEGVQQIANLRVCEKSNQWNRVANLIINEKNAA